MLTVIFKETRYTLYSQEFEQLLNQSRKQFELSCQAQFRLNRLPSVSADKNMERSPYKVLLNRKSHLIRQNLKKRHFQLLCIVQKMVKPKK